MQDASASSVVQDLALGALWDNGAVLLSRAAAAENAISALAQEGNEMLARLFQYLIIVWAMTIRAHVDGLSSLFGLWAIFLVVYFAFVFVRWSMSQLLRRPGFRRLTLADFSARMTGYAVEFVGFIVVRLLVDFAQETSQFDEQLVLIQFVVPTLIFMVLALNHAWGNYMSEGPAGPWRQELIVQVQATASAV
jgi:hypothetical protein